MTIYINDCSQSVKNMQLLKYNKKLESLPTPFYFYDLDLLRETLDRLRKESERYQYHVHYAMKANSNDRILTIIRDAGLGADCVSGNEVQKALNTGFDPAGIYFAGVGKTDAEIATGLCGNIGCFNCESEQELVVLNQLAVEHDLTARIALRINPDVNGNTHVYITTGMEENKFGIHQWELEEILRLIPGLRKLELTGLHFHIGSQITNMETFGLLCQRINEINAWFINRGFLLPVLNLGGGLGIDYHQPDEHPVPDFKSYFETIYNSLKPMKDQEVHFELGRSVVGQMGSLISTVMYIKKGRKKDFVILDAGMTELIRPALYRSHHRITNISKPNPPAGEGVLYDIVGPICETTDFLGKDVLLPVTARNDRVIIRSTGAYGQVMSFNYNLRDPARVVYSDDL